MSRGDLELMIEETKENYFYREGFETEMDLTRKYCQNHFSQTLKNGLLHIRKVNLATKKRLYELQNIKRTDNCSHYQNVMSDPMSLNNEFYNRCLLDCRSQGLAKVCEHYEVKNG